MCSPPQQVFCHIFFIARQERKKYISDELGIHHHLLHTEKAVSDAVEKGILWILSGPASLCGEAVPPGIINNQAMLSQSPQRILPAEILEENLASAWKNGITNGLSILSALSSKVGANLPWKTIVDVITDALHARFIELDADSCQWPCDFPSAQSARFKVYSGAATGGPSEVAESRSNVLVAYSELDIYQLQDFLDAVPKLTDIKAKTGTALKFYVRIEAGDGESLPDHTIAEKISTLLRDIRDGWELR